MPMFRVEARVAQVAQHRPCLSPFHRLQTAFTDETDQPALHPLVPGLQGFV